MKIKVGKDTSCWNFISSTSTPDRRRYYIYNGDRRVLLVLKANLALQDIKGRVCAALIGWDQGMPGFAKVEGERQTKITITGVDRGIKKWDKTIEAIIRNAPMLDNE